MWKFPGLVIPDAALLLASACDGKAIVLKRTQLRTTVIASVAKQSIHRRVRKDGLLHRFRSSQGRVVRLSLNWNRERLELI